MKSRLDAVDRVFHGLVLAAAGGLFFYSVCALVYLCFW